MCRGTQVKVQCCLCIQCSHSESYQHLLMPVKFLVVFLWLATIFTAGFLLPLCLLVLGFLFWVSRCPATGNMDFLWSCLNPFKMGEHYIWTCEPLSWFPDSALNVEFLKRLVGVTSCNTLCNKPAALTKHSSPLALAGLFPLFFFFTLYEIIPSCNTCTTCSKLAWAVFNYK